MSVRRAGSASPPPALRTSCGSMDFVSDPSVRAGCASTTGSPLPFLGPELNLAVPTAAGEQNRQGTRLVTRVEPGRATVDGRVRERGSSGLSPRRRARSRPKWRAAASCASQSRFAHGPI